MYIVVNMISVPEAQRQAVIEGFKQALPSMKRFNGFLGMEVWTAEDGSMQAISRWDSKEAMEEYLQNDLFKQHHSGVSSQRMNVAQPAHYTAEVLS
ncbi:MAG TPA: antibiotic biosynthesis monooxygenase family protein [Ktedonobacteraceae bacterium]|nr:antibiotic biosynthesis monooxygenase family protein [Ktedonobacteraceae bacterium]